MSQFGRYEDLEEVGRGGFAIVYKAHDPKLKRAVALKVLHAGYGSDPEFSQRFQQEAQTIAQFSHHNIVTIYEVGEEDRKLFIAMEFLAGGNLQTWLNNKEKPLIVAEALSFLNPIAHALDYAHKRGIVHRDIKPSNIMLQQDDDNLRAVLTDFGLVKAMEASMALTMTNQVLGSPEYMAPEQVDPNRHDEIGPHTDLYAFGIVAYQMLTGRVPFPGQSNSTLYAQEYKPVPLPQELNPALPSTVADILVKMLSKLPEERYQTALAFVDALETTDQAVIQSQQHQAQVVPLYEKLQTAKDAGNWLEVIAFTAQIDLLMPDFKDVAALKAEAMQQLQHQKNNHASKENATAEPDVSKVEPEHLPQQPEFQEEQSPQQQANAIETSVSMEPVASQSNSETLQQQTELKQASTPEKAPENSDEGTEKQPITNQHFDTSPDKKKSESTKTRTLKNLFPWFKWIGITIICVVILAGLAYRIWYDSRPTWKEVFNEYRPQIEKKSAQYQAIAELIPARGSVDSNGCETELNPLPIYGNSFEPHSPSVEKEINTDIRNILEITGTYMSDTEFDLITKGELSLYINWLDRPPIGASDTARLSLDEEIEAALATKYLVVYQTAEYQYPTYTENGKGIPGHVTLESFVVDLETTEILCQFVVEADGRAPDSEEDEKSAHSHLWDQARKAFKSGFSEITGGTMHS